MEKTATQQIIPAMLGGLLMGFSIGAGFILAKRILDRPKSSDKSSFIGEQSQTKEGMFILKPLR